MRRTLARGAAACALAAGLLVGATSATAAGNPMKLVGALNPWKDGQFSNVAADASRKVSYLGSFDDQGVAVIDTSTPAAPTLREVLSTHITSDALTSDSADLDLVGRYLAVSHQPWSADGAFSGISIYDTQANPYDPTLLRRVALPGGIHTVQLDPEVESGRPYAYANAFEFGATEVFIVNILTGAIVGTYQSPEPQGCVPSDASCLQFNSPHEGFLQRHPRSGRMLDYVSYWDSGLRIVDVTNPASPVEVGSFDYPGQPGNCCAHYAAATPSGNTVYLEDELGVGGTGGVHVLDARACDGRSYCTPAEVGLWHINGHPVQAAAINGRGRGAFHGVIQRFFTWDAHNLDVKGENTLLVANYTMGIRLIDTTDKTKPGRDVLLPAEREQETSPATKRASSRDERPGARTSGRTGTSTRPTSGSASSSSTRADADGRGALRRRRLPSYARAVRLYLIRHAEAEKGEPDELRRLTPAGTAAARRLGRELAPERLDAVLSSPLLRARETAELVAKACGLTAEPDERLAPGAGSADVLAAIAGRGEAVAVVGHQPDCSNVAVALTGHDPGFPAGDVARLDLPA